MTYELCNMSTGELERFLRVVEEIERDGKVASEIRAVLDRRRDPVRAACEGDRER